MRFSGNTDAIRGVQIKAGRRQRPEPVDQGLGDCGRTLNNAYMQHSLLALVVIPELRISDVGLVDVRTFEKVELFV